MNKVVFIRHGESVWNLENRFTGWTDVDLSPNGLEEAREAGRLLKHSGYEFDYAFTSVLKRAIHTLWVIQDVMDLMWLPVQKDWRLNERHYGALQGLNKAEVADHYGEEQVHQWRRGFAVKPPELGDGDPRLADHDRRYADVPQVAQMRTESLQDTMHRAIQSCEEVIVPQIRAGKRVLLAAHGNSLRALVKHLEQVSDEAIMELNIPTGEPLVYEFDDNFGVMDRYYLSEQETMHAA